MTRHTLSRLLSLTVLAFLVAVLRPEARAQEAAAVTLKVVKYAELSKVIRQNAGKVVVVDFWSETCIPCKKNFPHVVEMSKKYASQGLVVISVSVDANPQAKETQETALQFLRARQATFTNLILDEPDTFWAERLGIQSLPAVFVFNRDGKWRKFTGDEAQPEEIEKLAAEWLKTK